MRLFWNISFCFVDSCEKSVKNYTCWANQFLKKSSLALIRGQITCFSEKNIILTNKSRSEYSLRVQENQNYLPVLENDTNNIIVYKNDLEKFKKERKKRFWEKLINNEE